MSNDQNLSTKIDNIEFTLEGIESNVKSIKELLTGNPLNTTDKGLIGRIVELEGKVKDLEAFKDKAIWVGIGLSMGAGFSLAKIIQLFAN